RHRALLGLPPGPVERMLPLHGATAAVLSGARTLLGPQPQAELAARRRLDRLASA
ncbi:MAG: DUF2236 domain-containing protein, partial [Leifsonia sp.]|nr:DUF2236 domain-containing protein [Leifsonia sp.]